MNKLIGGLLILSLLGRPALLRVDYIAYEFYKSNSVIISFLKKDNVVIEEDDEEEKIDELMKVIDDNKRYISDLVSQKNKVVDNLDDIMRQKAMARQTLNNEFILEFQQFNELYNAEKNTVESSIDVLSNADFNGIQQEMLHTETDYEYIVAEFEEVIESQNSIISFLEGLINKGKQTLNLCY